MMWRKWALLVVIVLGPWSIARATEQDRVLSAVFGGRSPLALQREKIADGQTRLILRDVKTKKKILIQTFTPDGSLLGHQEFSASQNTPTFSLEVNQNEQVVIEKTPGQETVSTIEDGKVRRQTFKIDKGQRVLVSDELLDRGESRPGQLTCEPARIAEELRTLAGHVFLQGQEGEYHKTALEGLRIHDSCVRAYGAQVGSQVLASLQRGLQCLTEHGGPAARSHLARIAALVSNRQKPLKVHCARELRRGVEGRATADPLDPDYPEVALNPAELVASDIPSTFFHELIHVCGYRHNVDVEHSWACEDCCFGQTLFNSAQERSTPACRVCGQHQNADDRRYLEDLVDYRNSGAARTLLRQIAMGHPQARNRLRLFAESITFTEGSDSLMQALIDSGGVSVTEMRDFRRLRAEPGSVVVGPTERQFAEGLNLLSRGGSKQAALDRFEGAIKASQNLTEPKRSFNRNMMRLVLTEFWAHHYDADARSRRTGTSSAETQRQSEAIERRAYQLRLQLQ